MNLPGSLEIPYDLIFIGADKPNYSTYLSQILELSKSDSTGSRLLRPGGLIVADNILRRGPIADPSPENLWAAKEKQADRGCIRRSDDKGAPEDFNEAMTVNPRIDVFLLPMFDGLGMDRLVD